MWRSLLNSARGRSSVGTTIAAATPFAYPQLVPPTVSSRPRSIEILEQRPEPEQATRPPSFVTTDAPARCCVHCGHVLYVPPKVLRMRCPKCSVDLPAKDIHLTGEIHAEQVLTAGKIVVGADGRVSAQLVACSVDIAGMVLGTVLASHTCRLRATAKVAGNLLCRHLQIDPGARLEGTVELIRS
jgi:hypothetical protein